MRVVCSDDRQRVMDAGQEACQADGSVHFHSFMKGMLGLALVMSMVNTSPW